MNSQDTTANASRQDDAVSSTETRPAWQAPEVRVLRIPSDTLSSTASSSDGSFSSTP